MRNRLAGIVGAVLLVLPVAAGAAGFVNDRRGWSSMTPDTRAAYVQGLNDSLNYIFADDTLAEALAKQGRTKCLAELKLSAANLAERMSFFYQNPNNGAYAPTAVYILKMSEICKVYIDRERAAFGLGPG